jgi:hypothetical protein
MRLLNIIILVFSFMPANGIEPAMPAVRVLYQRDGVLSYGSVNAIKARDTTLANLSVSHQYYISRSNLSARSEKVARQDLSFELPEVTATFQDQPHVLKKGVIVLGKDKKPYLVEAVFPDNKVVLAPLEINPNSRHRLEQNTNLAPIQRENVKIVSTSDILAVEQTCFLRQYCKGQILERINNIPICEAYAIRNNITTPTLNINCGRIAGATINATFSDGTLMLHHTLINPFPESAWKYQLDATPTTAQ